MITDFYVVHYYFSLLVFSFSLFLLYLCTGGFAGKLALPFLFYINHTPDFHLLYISNCSSSCFSCVTIFHRSPSLMDMPQRTSYRESFLSVPLSSMKKKYAMWWFVWSRESRVESRESRVESRESRVESRTLLFLPFSF
jgi:hypothetical protein